MSEASASAPRRFDVLTITWNNLEGLQRTWDSVSSQDFDNWRWLIVDGGSTVGTVEWLTSLTDERVDWQSGPDGGIYDAMNKGIDRSTGDIVVFLNAADTFSTSQVLGIVDRNQRDHQWQWAYGVMRYIDESGAVEGIHFTPKFSMNDLRLGLRFVGHQSAFFTHHMVEQLGHYRPQFGYAADQEYMLRAAEISAPTPIPHMLADFLLGGVSKDVAPDYFIRSSRQMRKDHDVLVQGNDAIDAVITTGLAVSARVRYFAAKSWRSIAGK